MILRKGKNVRDKRKRRKRRGEICLYGEKTKTKQKNTYHTTNPKKENNKHSNNKLPDESEEAELISLSR